MPSTHSLHRSPESPDAGYPPDPVGLLRGRARPGGSRRPDSAYPRLLNAVYRLHESGAGLLELLNLLPEAAAAHGGDFRAAVAAWQEAIGGDLRVVDLGLRLGGRRPWITCPHRG